jgi:hypothetical protein
MTGSALSLAVGMARNAASHLEVKDRVPRVDTVEKLASVLHVSPGFLAFGVEHLFELAAESVSAGRAAAGQHATHPRCPMRVRPAFWQGGMPVVRARRWQGSPSVSAPGIVPPA